VQPSRGPSVRGLKQVFMLQRADHGNRRFGTLVLVHARWGEAIEATVAFVVEHRNPCIVVAAEPSGRKGEGVEPKVVVGEMPRTGAGVCNTGDLDGLLVERRLRVVRSSTPNRGDRQTSVVGFATHQPFEKIETSGMRALWYTKRSSGHGHVRSARTMSHTSSPASWRRNAASWWCGSIRATSAAPSAA